MSTQINDPKTQRTFVVLGCPRGGTSLLAGSLHLSGIYMGNFRTAQYEDPEFKIPPKASETALYRLNSIITERNSRYEYWGWKVPNNIYYIQRIQHLLINPTYLFVYRNPEAIAKSSAKHDGKDWLSNREKLLQVANNHTQMVLKFQQSLDESASQYTFQLEDIHANPIAYIATLRDIVYPIKADLEALCRFVTPSGGYQRIREKTCQ